MWLSFRDSFARLGGEAQQPICIGQQHLAARRYVQPLLAAHEELRADRGLELLDPAGHAGRHAMELPGGARHAAFLGDGFEDRKVR